MGVWTGEEANSLGDSGSKEHGAGRGKFFQRSASPSLDKKKEPGLTVEGVCSKSCCKWGLSRAGRFSLGAVSPRGLRRPSPVAELDDPAYLSRLAPPLLKFRVPLTISFYFPF